MLRNLIRTRSVINRYLLITVFIFFALFIRQNYKRYNYSSNYNPDYDYYNFIKGQRSSVDNSFVSTGYTLKNSDAKNVLEYADKVNADSKGQESRDQASGDRSPNAFSHPLENYCKYPVLDPNDETLQDLVTHPKGVLCNQVQSDYVIFDPVHSTLKINQSLIARDFGGRNSSNFVCQYRLFGGTLRPRPLELNYSSCILLDVNKSTKVSQEQDQFEVQCHYEFINEDGTHNQRMVYRWAFAHVPGRRTMTPDNNSGNYSKYSSTSETHLSVDIIVLDSTSLNAFKRHAPETYDYMKNVMGFYQFDGYTKVADNSMVNLLPILTGMRFLNMSYKNHHMPSDFPENKILDFDSMPLVWKRFANKKCITMLNDDIADYNRGFFYYPSNQAAGFFHKPTDYYYRPWHFYHRRYPIQNASQFCFGNLPYFQPQLEIINSFISTYDRTCHFSFSFFTELPHDNPSNLERMDQDLYSNLKNLYSNHKLNNSILIIMGDHGNRISRIMYKYIGRIEERMSLLTIYFPEWFRAKYKDIVVNLMKNKHRLTSNYDLYQTLKDIADENFEVETSRDTSKAESDKPKGISLFRPIPIHRTCYEANVPDFHCICLELQKELSSDDLLYYKSYNLVLNFTRTQFLTSRSKCPTVTGISIIEAYTYTTSQMIQHGVRNNEVQFLKRLEKHMESKIEYIEIFYNIHPIDVQAKIRLQHNKENSHLKINVKPLLLNYANLCLYNEHEILRSRFSYCHCFDSVQ